MKCPNCDQENPQEAEYCLNCGEKLEGSALLSEVKDIIDSARVESRYAGMKTIAIVYQILSWGVSLLAIFVALRVYKIQGEYTGFIIILILGGIVSTVLHSSGDRLKVIVDTEENTRQTAEYLRRILDLLNRNMEG